MYALLCSRPGAYLVLPSASDVPHQAELCLRQLQLGQALVKVIHRHVHDLVGRERDLQRAETLFVAGDALGGLLVDGCGGGEMGVRGCGERDQCVWKGVR